MKKKKTPPELIPGTQKAILIAIDGSAEPVMAHTNQMLFLGYHAFVEAGKQGIDLSTLISLSGKLDPQLKKVLQNLKERNKELKKTVPSSHFFGLRSPGDIIEPTKNSIDNNGSRSHVVKKTGGRYSDPDNQPKSGCGGRSARKK